MLTVCEWFGLKTTRMVFTDLASEPVVTVSGGLASKSVVTVSSGLASKPAVTVSSGLASKPVATDFSSLASKLVATVSPGGVGFLVEPQNQGGEGFPGLGLKTRQASVCRLCHKTDGGRCHTRFLRQKPDAHRMYAQDQVVIGTVRM
jgi:hypothetical protein